MRLREIVDTTVSLIGNEDEKIKLEVEQHIHNLRAKYLKQHFERYGLSRWMLQTIVVDMEIDTYSPLCNGASCKVNISTVEIPRPIRGLSYTVSTIGGESITETTLEKWKFQKYDKYAKGMRYVLLNNKLIIPNNNIIKQVKIEAPFEYPHLLYKNLDCTNCGLEFEDYPLHIDYIPIIQQEIVNLYVRQQDNKTEEV